MAFSLTHGFNAPTKYPPKIGCLKLQVHHWSADCFITNYGNGMPWQMRQLCDSEAARYRGVFSTSQQCERRNRTPRSNSLAMRKLRRGLRDFRRQAGLARAVARATMKGIRVEYRCKGIADRWHFCRNCSRWPESDFTVVSSTIRFPDSDVCAECTALHDGGECQTGA